MKISAIIADANGSLLTGEGASTALKILRVVDEYMLDWSDLTFRAAGWGSLTTPLVEMDATNLPGAYQKEVEITAWADGFYRFLVHFDDATTVLNFQGEQYIQGGREVEVNCDAAVSSRASEAGGNLAAILEDTAVIGALGAGLTAITGKTNLIPAVPASQADAQAVPAAVKAAILNDGNAFAGADVGLIKAGVAAVPTTPLLSGDSRLNNLDAAVSSRAPEALGNVAAIKAKTDNLPGSPAAVGSAMTLTSAYDAAKSAAPESGGNVAAVRAKTDNLPSDPASNTQVNTRLATSGYAAPDNTDIGLIKAKTDNLPAAPAIEGNVQGHVADALTAYDPPTRAEATADKEEVLTAVEDISVGAVTVNPVQIFEGLSVTMSADLLAVNIDGVATKTTLKQGEAKTLTLTVKGAAGAPVDLSAAALTLGVKKDKSDAAYTISKLDAAFGKAQAALGIVTVDLSATDTNQTPGTYIGELKCSWTGGAVVDKSADFYLQIKKAVT